MCAGRNYGSNETMKMYVLKVYNSFFVPDNKVLMNHSRTSFMDHHSLPSIPFSSDDIRSQHFYSRSWSSRYNGEEENIASISCLEQARNHKPNESDEPCTRTSIATSQTEKRSASKRISRFRQYALRLRALVGRFRMFEKNEV